MALIKASSLPGLSGSEKQVEWANDIRLQYLSECVGPMAVLERNASGSHFERVTVAHTQVIASHTEAKWWIDNRNDFGVVNQEMALLLKKGE